VRALEFCSLLDGVCGAAAHAAKAKTKIFSQLNELADDGDDDGAINDPHVFAVVATRKYGTCRLGLPIYCTKWSGSVEKFAPSLAGT